MPGGEFPACASTGEGSGGEFQYVRCVSAIVWMLLPFSVTRLTVRQAMFRRAVPDFALISAA